MRSVRTLATVAALALLAAGPGHAAPLASSTGGGAAAEAAAAVDIGLEAALARINELRAQAGAAPLALSAQLTAAAQGHADDMAAKRYFSHTSRDGRTPGQRITAAGYRYSTYGENIAWGYADWAAAIAGWMRSAGHRANLLNIRFRELGLGLKNRYYVAVMAAPRTAR
jgi:uncharacterized protein YkwD